MVKKEAKIVKKLQKWVKSDKKGLKVEIGEVKMVKKLQK